MIETAELQVYEPELRGFLLLPVPCLRHDNFAIYCLHSKEEAFTAFPIAHFKSGHRIFIAISKMEALHFVRELSALNLDWDFRDFNEIPDETFAKASKFFIEWEAKFDDIACNEEWEDSIIKQQRSTRKLRERKLRDLKRKVKAGEVDCYRLISTLLPSLCPEQISLLVR